MLFQGLGFVFCFAHVYLAQRRKGHLIYFIYKMGTLNKIFEWIKIAENLFVGTDLHGPNSNSSGKSLGVYT